MNDVTTQSVAGSTYPLVELPRDIEDAYNPFENRKVSHPTS